MRWYWIDRFVEFAQRFQPDLSTAYRIDLRYDDMVICAQKEQKKDKKAEPKDPQKEAERELRD